MTSPKRPTVGDIIRGAREDIRFTQTAFADELGVSRRTLSRWEYDATVPESWQLPGIVRTLQRYDRVVSERVAGQLGVTSLPGLFMTDMDGALEAAATSLGVPRALLRGALAKLIGQCQVKGLTLEELATWLESQAT